MVKAKHTAAKVHVVNASKGSALLPPEGNDDWQKVEVGSVKVELSSSHPSVAIASFTLMHPLADLRIAGMEDVLRTRPELFSPTERRVVEKRIADRAIQNSEFAMLAERREMEIVSMSMPD